MDQQSYFKNSKHVLTHDDDDEPQDTYNLAYALHFFLGAGTLLPWNAFITAVDYFAYLYPNRHVERVFSVAYMASSLLILVLLLGLGRCRGTATLRLRMNGGFSMFVVSLMVTPMMYWFCHGDGTKMRSGKAYCVVVGSVVLCGMADGLIGGSLIGSAGMLPKRYMQAIFAGTASSGVVISVLRIITKASLPQTPRGLKTSAHLYFILTSAFLIACIAASNLLHRLPLMLHHSRHHPATTSASLRRIRLPAFGIFSIYVVTLSIFPGFLAEDVRSDILGDWYPVAVIAAYNVADLAGKLATGVYLVRSVDRAAWGCVARVVFYPLFVGCLRGPAWLRTEAPVVALTMMLGFTNGYLTSVVMILAPKEVEEAAAAEVAAIVMAVALGVGLVVGSLIGWIWII